jgi:hypothetical protein
MTMMFHDYMHTPHTCFFELYCMVRQLHSPVSNWIRVHDFPHGAGLDMHIMESNVQRWIRGSLTRVPSGLLLFVHCGGDEGQADFSGSGKVKAGVGCVDG